MYNKVTYPKETVIELIKNEFFTEKEMDVLIGYYSLDDCQTTVSKFSKYLGYSHFAPINSISGRMGKKMARKLNLPLRIRDDGSESGWDVIFEGELGIDGLLWKLKKPFIEAFKQLEYEESTFDIEIEKERSQSIQLYEGIKQTITVNKYERNKLARSLCLEKFGFSCQACDFNFLSFYGDIGKNYIHVHHIIPLSKIGKEYKIDPENDLVPVCPNCHAMIHKKRGETLSISELRKMINKS